MKIITSISSWMNSMDPWSTWVNSLPLWQYIVLFFVLPPVILGYLWMLHADNEVRTKHSITTPNKHWQPKKPLLIEE